MTLHIPFVLNAQPEPHPARSSQRGRVSASLLFAALAITATLPAAATEPLYEIVKATEDQVWRMNRQTGEIAVCKLESEQLVCTSSTTAATPPAKSYSELEAERAEQAATEARDREEDRKRKMVMLNLMMEAFRGLAEAGESSTLEGSGSAPSASSGASEGTGTRN